MILAWNSHPFHTWCSKHTASSSFSYFTHPHPAEVPQCSTAVSEYRQQGGQLTDPRNPGDDPFAGDDALCSQTERLWQSHCGMDVAAIFTETISGNTSVLENAITSYN